ncbi:hypothetical protein FHQ18_11605 [Deferribacter autotrophicus]|uniref:Uncharacterized protein n=1 Tax=Deferribacter autotrophicus TaxID=500465 RepID=A0A5A8F0R9_9BACT|nr:hypothetical protein [Deferribacter autotrophicus]KAA0257203.1 hypothetical protein FHQ18_11605 [Deferribacter autotrophicus]
MAFNEYGFNGIRLIDKIEPIEILNNEPFVKILFGTGYIAFAIEDTNVDIENHYSNVFALLKKGIDWYKYKFKNNTSRIGCRFIFSVEEIENYEKLLTRFFSLANIFKSNLQYKDETDFLFRLESAKLPQLSTFQKEPSVNLSFGPGSEKDHSKFFESPVEKIKLSEGFLFDIDFFWKFHNDDPYPFITIKPKEIILENYRIADKIITNTLENSNENNDSPLSNE